MRLRARTPGQFLGSFALLLILLFACELVASHVGPIIGFGVWVGLAFE
jgi:hypothetical protein